MAKVVVERVDGKTVRLSLAGRTKDVAVRDVWGDGVKLVSEDINGVCKHRTGKKLYPVRMEFFMKNGTLKLQSQYCLLNRQAMLIGWLEDYKDVPELTLRY